MITFMLFRDGSRQFTRGFHSGARPDPGLVRSRTACCPYIVAMRRCLRGSVACIICGMDGFNRCSHRTSDDPCFCESPVWQLVHTAAIGRDGYGNYIIVGRIPDEYIDVLVSRCAAIGLVVDGILTSGTAV